MTQPTSEALTICLHCGAELDEPMPGRWVSGGGMLNCRSAPTGHLPSHSPPQPEPDTGGVE